ncbi:MAG: hypothetical protein V1770_04040 [bacterium]
MVMKLLAIFSDRIFFQEDTIEEEVPNFFNWLAEERGILLDNLILGNDNGTFDLRRIYKLVLAGLLEEELLAYCGKYNEFYFNEERANELYKLNIDFDIFIFTSCPKELYYFLEEKGIVNKVFGAQAYSDSKGKIMALKEIELRNREEVRKRMTEFGFGENFTFEPNKYGLTELLIDQIIADNLSAEDVVALGKEITAFPARKVAGKIIERLEEIE